ncbi:MAG: hypothetical protein M9958_05185 [Chitinophagales bacterium]|nr:hypothetical protein [Chitinophagales bacterium]
MEQNTSNQKIVIECTSLISELNIEVWNRIVGQRFYAHSSHLKIIEELNQAEMKFFYLLIQLEGEYCAAIYFQQIPFKVKNGLNNFKEKNKNQWSWVTPFLSIANNIKLPLLKSGNIFFTEDNGVYFIDTISEEKRISVLEQVSDYIYSQCKNAHSISLMWSNLIENHGKILHEDKGFQSLGTEPNMIFELQPEWQIFEEYLSDFSSKYRQRAKRVFVQSQDLVIKELKLEEVDAVEHQLVNLYRNVAQHASFNLAFISKGYFFRMKQLYGNDFVVKVYLLDYQIVGFTSSIYHNKQHYVHFIGLDYKVNIQVPVYHRMLFEYVRESINLRHTKIYLGRTATEIKTTIGAVPIEMKNYLKISKVWYLSWLPAMLGSFGAKPYIVRRPFKST